MYFIIIISFVFPTVNHSKFKYRKKLCACVFFFPNDPSVRPFASHIICYLLKRGCPRKALTCVGLLQNWDRGRKFRTGHFQTVKVNLQPLGISLGKFSKNRNPWTSRALWNYGEESIIIQKNKNN